VGQLAAEYMFWVGLTVLIVVGLGRLKRWLLRLVSKKKTPFDKGV
jgi:hypothetical protein